ncbi:MAG: undecaprenyl-diphosphate phosphatase [Phycisphaeraceae bacterium]
MRQQLAGPRGETEASSETEAKGGTRGWRDWLTRPEVGFVVALLFVAAVVGVGAMLESGPVQAVEPVTAAEAADAGGVEGASVGGESAMTLPQVVVISVVQGVTEFLPISSTGHILLVQRAMGIPAGPAADAFAVCIQAGAVLAILGLYFRRTRQIGMGLLGRDAQGLKLGVNIVLAFLPSMFAALLFYEPIMAMFGLGPSVVTWFLGGLVIIWVARWHSRRTAETAAGAGGEADAGTDAGTGGGGGGVDDVTWRMALIIGLIQCLALVPGTSRALAAILGCLLVGMSMRASVEFSFLLGVITLTAAGVYEGWQNGFEMFTVYGWHVLLVGLIVTAIAAAAAVKWMVSYLDRYSIAIFGYYRIALALGVGLLLLVGYIEG